LNYTNSDVASNARRLLLYQLVVGIAIAAGFGFYQTKVHAISAFVGAMISSLSTLMLTRGVMRAEQQAKEQPQAAGGALYFGAAQRFALVLVLFILGLKFLNLDPVAMCVGFAAAQLGFMLSFRRLSKPN
jgi:ATP synthase protein I